MDQGPDQGLQQHGLEGEDGMQVGSSKLLNLIQWPLKCPPLQVPSLKQQLHYVVRQITAFYSKLWLQRRPDYLANVKRWYNTKILRWQETNCVVTNAITCSPFFHFSKRRSITDRQWTYEQWV